MAPSSYLPPWYRADQTWRDLPAVFGRIVVLGRDSSAVGNADNGEGSKDDDGELHGELCEEGTTEVEDDGLNFGKREVMPLFFYM